MENLKEEIAKKVDRIIKDKEVLNQANERLEKSAREIAELVKQANETKDQSSNEYKQLYDEITRRSKSVRRTEAIYKKKEEDLKKRIETDRKRIIDSLTGKKARIEKLMGVDLKNVNIDDLNKEERKLREAEKLVRVTSEEYSNLTSEQQGIVRQAQRDYNDNQKRLKSIKELKSFMKAVGNRKPEDVLKDIDDVIRDVTTNFTFEDIDKLNRSNTKTTNEGSKDDKSKKDSKDNKDSKDKQDLPKDDDINLKGKLDNNEKDIEKYKIKMEKYKNDPQKRKTYEACKRMVEELEAENEEIRRKLNIKGPDKKDDKTKSADDKDEKDDKTKSDDDKDKEDDKTKKDNSEDKDTENLKGRYRANKNKILEYVDLLNRYKDDPLMTKSINDAINKLKEENKRIFDELNKEENIEKGKKTTVLSNLQKGEQKQKEGNIEIKLESRPTLLHDRIFGDYIYANKKGETFRYDFFSKEDGKRDGKYLRNITRKQEKAMRKKAMKTYGLTKKQAEAMDVRWCMVLDEQDPEVLDNYMKTLKGDKNTEQCFDMIYDERAKGRKIERFIGYRNQAKIMKVAKKQAQMGIATYFKDKSRALAYGLLSALGIAAALGVSKGPDLLNKGNEPTIEETGNQKDLNENVKGEIKGDKEQGKDSDTKNPKDVQDSIKNQQSQGDTEKNEGQGQVQNENENEFGYVKVAQGAMLYRDPTDELRIMNGINANEKVTIKQTSGDKLYTVTKIGYYSKTGEYVAVEAGESLEEALSKKGLDISFVQNDNSVKMYHVVAEGIAEWVHEDDVEFVKVKTDKFGNRVDKTEEEKAVDEAEKEYYASQQKQAGSQER